MQKTSRGTKQTASVKSSVKSSTELDLPRVSKSKNKKDRTPANEPSSTGSQQEHALLKRLTDDSESQTSQKIKAIQMKSTKVVTEKL